MLLLLFVILLLILLTPIKFPIWFPSSSSWLKALFLAFPTWIGSNAIFSLGFWLFCFATYITFTSSDPPAPLEALVLVPLLTMGLLAASLVWYLLQVWLYSQFLRLLWSELPQCLRWFKPPRRKRDLIFNWGVFTVAILLGSVPFSLQLFVLMFHPAAIYLDDKAIEEFLRRQPWEKIIGGWYVVAAYLYHFRSLLKPRNTHPARSARG